MASSQEEKLNRLGGEWGQTRIHKDKLEPMRTKGTPSYLVVMQVVCRSWCPFPRTWCVPCPEFGEDEIGDVIGAGGIGVRLLLCQQISNKLSLILYQPFRAQGWFYLFLLNLIKLLLWPILSWNQNEILEAKFQLSCIDTAQNFHISQTSTVARYHGAVSHIHSFFI